MDITLYRRRRNDCCIYLKIYIHNINVLVHFGLRMKVIIIAYEIKFKKNINIEQKERGSRGALYYFWKNLRVLFMCKRELQLVEIKHAS